VSWSSPLPEQQPHIGINAHLLSAEAGYRRAGIHQYIDQVLHHLPAGGPTYTIYTRQLAGWERDDWRLAGSRLPTENRLARIAWEQAVWPVVARRDGLALMHSMAFVAPRLAPCPVVVTIYDLSFVHYPDSFPALQRRYLMAETAHAGRRATRLIAISASGRDDIARVYGVPRERIDVVRPGVSAAFQPLPPAEVEAFRRRRGLPERFLLHVGTLQPRKNIPLLLEALARPGGPDVPLILVGGKGWMYEAIDERIGALGLAGRVHFAGYVDDDELPLWYNAAAALVFPSLYEGFGLPIVEALACGAPVVAARASSLPEAGGDVARYFDPNDPDALAACLRAVLADPAEHRRARQTGPAHAAGFSWARAGRETAEVYARALGYVGSAAP
jgi:glycosyltransferase involved in cell wall biosynthesis